MIKRAAAFILLSFLTIGLGKSQSMHDLRQRIVQVLENKTATVGVAIRGMSVEDTLSINGDKHLPMQSVYKYHLALAVLDQVDQGNLSLDTLITLDKKLIDSYQHLWSPLRQEYPDGQKLTLAKIIEFAVAWSDNLGCDVLFDLVGGPVAVQSYLHDRGIKNIAIAHTEIEMQSVWQNQYQNWTTAKAANQALQLLFENTNDTFSSQSRNFLLNVLKGTKTGKKSIRSLLPKGVTIAHKTGHSGKNEDGLTGAVNDIGILFLPDGSYFYLSVLVSDSKESDEVNQRIIAEIAKLAWDYFTRK